MLELAIVVGLVVLTSAACSLFEAVLYSVPHSQIDALERAGRPSGRILRTLRAQVDRPIAAILSLNTVANTGGAALGQSNACRASRAQRGAMLGCEAKFGDDAVVAADEPGT